jgi:hypothetical protein
MVVPVSSVISWQASRQPGWNDNDNHAATHLFPSIFLDQALFRSSAAAAIAARRAARSRSCGLTRGDAAGAPAPAAAGTTADRSSRKVTGRPMAASVASSASKSRTGFPSTATTR